MRGKRTAIILGAGASYCYEDGNGPLPLQKDLVGQIGGISASSGNGAPELVGPNGLIHSRALAKILQQRYNIPENQKPGANQLVFWEELQKRGESLETVYSTLEESLPPEQQGVLADFSAVIRTSVKKPIPNRELKAVCRHHRNLVQALEPGDYIIDFNWDSLMADALLYFCPFWYPRTGFGPWIMPAVTDFRIKVFALQSFVKLYHIHGSVLLYEALEKGPDSKATGNLLYVGPPGYTEMDSLASLLGLSKKNKKPKQSASDLESWAITRGYIYLQDYWFKPLFVPPSSMKNEYRHRYHQALRSYIHSVLPKTDVFLVSGYSFPPADIGHLKNIFVSAVMKPDAEVITVDPSCPEREYQSRVRSVFTGINKFNFELTDFKHYTSDLESKDLDVFT